MSKRIMIVDGYNVIHRTDAWRNDLARSLGAGREKLLRYCGRWVRERGDVWTFYVVFDGESGVGMGRSQAHPGVRVLFTKTSEKADDRILDIIAEYGDRFRYAVVSDDNYVRRNARDLGAEIVPVDQFVTVLAGADAAVNQTGDMMSRRKRGGKQRAPKGEVNKASLHPADEKAITDELRRRWAE